MSDLAIKVENLGKMYRIGKENKPARNWRQRIGRLATAPFGWLTDQLRGPSEEEIIWALMSPLRSNRVRSLASLEAAVLAKLHFSKLYLLSRNPQTSEPLSMAVLARFLRSAPGFTPS